ncbi:MAG: tetratricopeptide repeat protein [Candidatus Peregrinibacteria bacterium]
MKKVLALLWVIIITSAIFVAIQLTGPKSTENGPPEENKPTEGTEETVTEIQNNYEPAAAEPTLTFTQYMSAGDKSFSEGEIYDAIDNYQLAIKLNPNSLSALMKLGNAALLANDPKKAEETFSQAEKIDSESIEIKIGITRSLLNQRNIEGAKTFVWTLSDSDYGVKYYTGIILVLYKDFEGAKNIFTQLAQAPTEQTEEVSTPIDPALKAKAQIFADTYTNFSYFTEAENIFLETLLAKALTDTGEYESAIPLLYDVLNQKNNYRDAWIVLGYAYLNTDKIPDAIDALTQAKSLDEDKPETLFFLGLAYFANDDIDRAISFLEQAEKKGFEPRDEIELRLGDLYLIKEKYSQASLKYENVLALNTNSMDVFVRAIWLNIEKLNNPTKALTLADTALKTHPDEAMSYNLAGWALTAAGKYDDAKSYLAKSLELNPSFDAAYLNFGWLYEKKGMDTLAKEYYKKAYTLGSGNSIASLAATRFNNLQINISQP